MDGSSAQGVSLVEGTSFYSGLLLWCKELITSFLSSWLVLVKESLLLLVVAPGVLGAIASFIGT